MLQGKEDPISLELSFCPWHKGLEREIKLELQSLHIIDSRLKLTFIIDREFI